MPVTWSDEKLILLYCPGRGSNSRPPAHHSFNHEQGVPHPYSLGHGGGDKAFFFDYLVYGSADPILQDFEEKKKLYIFLINFFFFTNFQLSVPSPDKGGGQINYGVQGTQELEPTDIAREETRHGGGDHTIY